MWAPGILDNFYLNLLDWGSKNVVSIALKDSVYLWDVSDHVTYDLVTVDEKNMLGVNSNTEGGGG